MKSCFSIGLLFIGVVYSYQALPCSCGVLTVNQKYENSRMLILVRIGATELETNGEDFQTQRWHFEMIEAFKGIPEFERLWSSDHPRSSCRVYLIQGKRYLVSAETDGQVDFCSIWPVDREYGFRDEVDVLSAFKAGLIPELTQPWTFSKFPEECWLYHRTTDGDVRLRFIHRLKDVEQPEKFVYEYQYPMVESDLQVFRPNKKIPGEHPALRAGYLGLHVRYPRFNHVIEGSGEIIIGEQEWSTRRTTMEYPHEDPYEVVGEEDTREILAALVNASAISIQWRLWGLPEYQQDYFPDYPFGSAETNYLYFRDDLAKFQDCIAH